MTKGIFFKVIDVLSVILCIRTKIIELFDKKLSSIFISCILVTAFTYRIQEKCGSSYSYKL